MVFGTFGSGLRGDEGLALGRMAARAETGNLAFVKRMLGPKPVDIAALQRESIALAQLVAERDAQIGHLVAQLEEQRALYDALHVRARSYEERIKNMSLRLIAGF